jgi:hypothetical protein
MGVAARVRLPTVLPGPIRVGTLAALSVPLLTPYDCDGLVAVEAADGGVSDSRGGSVGETSGMSAGERDHDLIHGVSVVKQALVGGSAQAKHSHSRCS